MTRVRFLLSLYLILWSSLCIGQTIDLDIKESQYKDVIPEIFYIETSSSNLAVNAFSRHSDFSVSFDNRFLIKELMNEEISSHIRIKENVLDFRCTHFGWNHYGKFTAALGYARRFGKHISIGLRFHYLMEHALEYPCIHSITFDVSLHTRIGKNVGLGFSVYNPARLKFGIIGKNLLPTRLYFNFDYSIGRNVLIYTQIEEELKSAFRIEIGAYYKIRCLILTPFFSFPTPSFGLKVHLAYQRFIFTATGTYHLHVGFVPGIKISCLF